MQDSIFSKIVRGEIPCHKIYEDELTLAFLDIHPKQPGHTLVIPKQQVAFVWDLDERLYTAVLATVRKVAQRQREVLGAPYIGEHIMGTDVPHAHVHVFPFTSPAEFHMEPDMSAEPDHVALADMAMKLTF
ncbi:MAG TPA: HIT domain-containing protein [Candidatus Saccharimonadales bacterium]|nr:HIT domain-containing protein [Candidatus Saccharimonadales bacterium]